MREFDLLAHVFRQNPALPARVTIPPGDDMGAVRYGEHDVLVTVDQIADGVHVDLRSTAIARVARKAITRNLSDVAAMAALPVGAVVACALPRDFGQARARELSDAMRRVAGEFNCPLFGGDLTFWDHPLLISVTVLAEPAGVTPVTRGGARPGDVVFVTGQLGGSIHELDGYCHHLDFTPRIDLARRLAALVTLNSMIDLSDGLGRDLGHIAAMSNLAAEVDADRLPLSRAARHAATLDGQPAWRHALADGEDYELCFTVAVDQADRVPSQIDGVAVTAVGRMHACEPGAARVVVRADERRIPADDLGWEHHTS
jgi:thiamine-monophosphate kinase